jgi:uncharacterized protein YjbJ (UPF0337 family)
MISLQKIFGFLMTVGLAIILSTGITSVLGTTNSRAVTSPTPRIAPSPVQIATMNKIEAITKNIEGKAQEAIGNITDDSQTKMLGKAKQVQSQNRNVEQAASQARNAAVDMKNKTKLKAQAKAMTKGIEDKVEAARGQ